VRSEDALVGPRGFLPPPAIMNGGGRSPRATGGGPVQSDGARSRSRSIISPPGPGDVTTIHPPGHQTSIST
jgi:hypothetical protein